MDGKTHTTIKDTTQSVGGTVSNTTIQNYAPPPSKQYKSSKRFTVSSPPYHTNHQANQPEPTNLQLN